MNEASRAMTRLLVVEDEYLIRMLLEDMLADLGYDVAAAVGTMAEAASKRPRAISTPPSSTSISMARRFFRSRKFWPSAACPSCSSPAMASAACPSLIAAARRCRSRSKPSSSRPRSPLARDRLAEYLRQLGHERLVGEIEPQRRDRDALVVERGEIAAGSPRRRCRRARTRSSNRDCRVRRGARRCASSSWSRLPCVAMATPATSSGGQSGKLTLTKHVARHAGLEHAADQVGREFDRGLPMRHVLGGERHRPATARTTECRARCLPWRRRPCPNR